jgi:hypothetical protein
MHTDELKLLTNDQLESSKIKAEEWARKKRLNLMIDSNKISENEFQQKKALIEKKLFERLSLLNSIIDSRKPKPQLGVLKVFFVLSTLFILWLQPWETPVEKISDEWKSCNSKYDGKCSYVGEKFKTNSFEMLVSTILYGEYGDDVCSRSRHWDQC